MKRFTQALVGMLAAVCVSAAMAQSASSFPNKAIKMIVPFAPGGATDLIARALAKEMSTELGQPVVIDNRPGAAGMLGLDVLTASPPDGYTIAQLPNATISALIFAKKPLDLDKRFIPIGNATLGYMLLAVNPALIDVKDIAGLIAHMKTHPDTLYTTSGQGSPSQLAVEALAINTGVKPLHVPYKGLAPAVVDVLAGRIAFIVAGSGTIMPHVAGGQMRPIAAFSSIRSPSARDVRTIAEQGFPQFNYDPEQGVIAPPGTPAPIVDRLRMSVKKAVASEGFVRAVRELETGAQYIDGPQWGEHITRDYTRWSEVVRVTGIKVE